MRKIFSTVLFGLLAHSAIAQRCDIAQSGVAVYNSANTNPVNTIQVGETANFRFSIRNESVNNGCAIPAGSVTAVFDFPTMAGNIKPYVYAGPPSFVSGYFTWIYNYAAEVLVGTNNREIPAGTKDLNITMRVRGNAAGAGNSNLNISQGKGVSDDATNNFSGARLLVSPVVIPVIKLNYFTVTPQRCDVLLKWATSEETAASLFEVEYSPDGFSFTKIGSVPGKQNAGGAAYEFTYTPPGEKGYYRLKQVSVNKPEAYSKDEFAVTACNTKGKISVYPNPVSADRKLVVNISGYEGKISGTLLDAAGRQVRTYNLANSLNELSLTGFSAGSYLLQVRDESGAVQSFKIIVTR